MEEELFFQLKNWRDEKALKLNLKPVYKVLSNQTLKNIALKKPRTEEELLAIKGIGKDKFKKYGLEILSLINNFLKNQNNSTKSEQKQINFFQTVAKDKIFSVSEYLDFINLVLKSYNFKVQGEVSSINKREKLIYFSLKDEKDESVLKCKMFKTDYLYQNFDLKEGLKIIVYGRPEIYKMQGSFDFLVFNFSLVGEGELKKIYEELKNRLKKEGIFDLQKKLKLPDLPTKIGLITSEKGAVIYDFLRNIKNFGFKIYFYNSRVQGFEAVNDLINGINYFKDKDIDVLVIIRGGGSLEDLQAFNNEYLVRQVAYFKKPVLVGIGHELDIPLVSLAAWQMFSTPTAVANFLNELWQKVVFDFKNKQILIFNIFKENLINQNHILKNKFNYINDKFLELFRKIDFLKINLFNKFYQLNNLILEKSKFIKIFKTTILNYFLKNILEKEKELLNFQKLIENYDPKKPLFLGYSLVKFKNKIIKSISELKIDQEVEIELKDGEFNSIVKKIYDQKG